MRKALRIGIAALALSGFVALGGAHADDKPLNINSASVAELTSLKGLGDAKAKAIVAYREKNGPFKSVDDLDQVTGIGGKLLASLRPQVTTGTSTGAPAHTNH